MPKETKTKDQKASKKTAGKAAGKTNAKPKKDKDAPKKPLTSFMIFSQENRQRVKEENPDATFGEMGKLLGAEWKKMSPSEKAPYEKKNAQEKVRYEKAMKAYQAGTAAKSSEEEEEEEEEEESE